MKFNRIFLAILAASSFALAQTSQENEIPLPKEANLAIIAIGPRPEVKYDGDHLAVRAADEYPPGILFTQGLEDEELKVRVGFNSGAPFTRVPARKTLSFKKRIASHSAEQVSFVSVPPISPGSRTLAFLRPTSSSTEMWKSTPKVSLLNLDNTKLDGKNIVVKNYTAVDLLFRLGNDTRKIKSLATSALKVTKAEADYEHLVVATEKNKDKVLIKTTLSIKPKHLNVLIFYAANPKTNRGKALGFFKAVIAKPHKIVVNEYGEEVSPQGFESDDASKASNSKTGE